MDAIWQWFRVLYDTSGINLPIFYDAFDRRRFASGVLMTLELSAISIVASVMIGIVGAWADGLGVRLTGNGVYW